MGEMYTVDPNTVVFDEWLVTPRLLRALIGKIY